jgi:hypothetical protein
MQGIVAGLGARLGQYREQLDGLGQPPVGRTLPPVYPPLRATAVYPAPAPRHDHGPDL